MEFADISASAVRRGAGSSQKGESEGPDFNQHLAWYLLTILASVGAFFMVWRALELSFHYARKITCLGNDRQRYFAIPSPNIAFIKRHIQDAPVFRKRHNREIQLSSAINVGTLPTRAQLVLIFGYFATNVAFCVIDLPFKGAEATAAAKFRNRTGVLATVNMIPLFLLAGRNNPFISLLGISFDTYNLIHRWLGRIVVLETLAHVLGHMAKSNFSGAAFLAIFKNPFLLWGFIGTCAFVVILIQASSPIRHAFYEIFKILHIVLAAMAFIGTWYHLKLGKISSIVYLYPVMAVWIFDRSARMLRLLYNNIGHSKTKTVVEALPGNACRVTVTLARPWKSLPGQHAYLYMPSISLWQSHPFSVAWSDEAVEDVTSTKKLGGAHADLESRPQNQVSFIIRARTGFTNSLYHKAVEAPGGRMETTAFVEGPYGIQHSLDSYGTVVLFAGGVGITHPVSYVRHLVAGFNDGTVATRKVLLVWTVQSPQHLEWIRPWMTEILGMERRRDVLRIMLFVSQPRSTKEIHSPSSTVQMFPGRPNIETLLAMEQEQQVGAMAVTVCGPGAFSDEVRRAVRARQDRTHVDFIEEAFSW